MYRTPLYDFHVKHSGKLVEFAGWEMPVMYTGIIEEHLATRKGCTMFDVSHMGRLYLNGSQSAELLEGLCTRAVGTMEPGQCRYSHMCKEDGGILDDVIVSRLNDRWLVVCNASNREKIVSWIQRHARAKKDVRMIDQTMSSAMVAIQGPEAAGLLKKLLPIDLSELKRYRCKFGQYMGVEYVISRTGYTGEDGYEIILPSAAAKMLVQNVFDPGGTAQGRIKPAGLGARDTLRLEAAMPLYGHELGEGIDSLTAACEWAVDLSKNFVGAEAMRKVKQTGLKKRLVGLEVEGKRIARQDTPIEKDGKNIGTVTSGTHSPTFDKVIALGYVDPAHANVGSELAVNIRGKTTRAVVVPLPFYKRNS